MHLARKSDTENFRMISVRYGLAGCPNNGLPPAFGILFRITRLWDINRIFDCCDALDGAIQLQNNDFNAGSSEIDAKKTHGERLR